MTAASTKTINTASSHAHHVNSGLINIACGFNVVANRTISINTDRMDPQINIFMAMVHNDLWVKRYFIARKGYRDGSLP